ncbi:hypothetical protein QF043_001666 [Pseudomonas sp. W3I7]|uniref:hypothetical protein n=1 Tax=Pseudomonas sp. W3I7 TaxID=3042292 RepID=UPI0027912A9E|nr:hypothetical protein [Pseudomonas sp. W3I7]MDQ0702874.1 hypothetical protein [Pseudomonas sp. W3I7]
MDLIFRYVRIEADLVLLDTRSVVDVILDLPARLMVPKRGKIVATSACQRSVVF